MFVRDAMSNPVRSKGGGSLSSWLAMALAPAAMENASCRCPCGEGCGLKGCGDSCFGTCDRILEVPDTPAPKMPRPPSRPPAPPGPSPTTTGSVAVPGPGPAPTSTTPRPEPLPPGTGQNLGVAAYPPNTSKFDATMYAWRARTLLPRDYRMGYALAGNEQESVRNAHNAYARKVHHESEDGEIFRWTPPPGCAGGLSCVFEQLVKRNRADLKPIVERFRARASAAKLDSMQTAVLVISWVQAIRYEVPKVEPFGVLPPALSAAESRGDCDSKALLALMILDELGIRGMLISSSIHRHTMLGIPLPVSGSYFTYAGRRYAFTECTAAGAPIGYMDPKLKSPNDWTAVPIKM